MSGDRPFRAFAIVFGLLSFSNFTKPLPVGVIYALYVTINVWLFRVRSPDLVAINSLYGITYIAIALAISWGAVAFLVRHVGALRRADPTR